MKVSKLTSNHYSWGDHCDGWTLVDHNELSIIHERMPPKTYERRHYHKHSRQFFFVLSGTATLEVDGTCTELHAQEGYEVPPLVPHQVFNKSNRDVEFIVTSQPNRRGDRFYTEGPAYEG